MKKLTLFFFFSYLGICLNAQVNLDSIYSIWQDETLTDSIRASAYVDYIWDGFLYSNPDSAEALAENLHNFSKEINFPLAAAESFEILGHINDNRSNFPLALEYHKQSLEIYESLGDKKHISRTLLYIGEIHHDQGDDSHALEYYKQSLKLEEELGSKKGISNCLTFIGNIYNSIGNYTRGLEYHQQSLNIAEELGSKAGIGISLMNCGISYENEGNDSLALENFEQSLKNAEELGIRYGVAVGLMNIGGIYEKQGNYSGALENYKQALKIREEIDHKPRIVSSLVSIGDIYNIQGNNSLALDFCKKGLRIAEEIKVLSHQKDACVCLYDAYKAMDKVKEALVYLERIQVIDDSLNTNETVKKLQQMEFAKQVFVDSLASVEKERIIYEAHQEEVDQKNSTRNALAAGGLLFLILAGAIYSRLRYTHKTKATLQVEKDRSEKLLLNILPADIAAELKQKGRADARDFDLASILFTDFKGFTAASEKLSAQDLVSEINTCFEAFDGIMSKYNVEKIKTIGDAYMAAGGLPVHTDDSVKNTVLAALEIQAFIFERKTEMDRAGKPSFEMRVGIHTGPVVAGIVGVNKFQYDIWGDTVNTASRMESSGEIGKVNISQSTYDLLKNDAQFTFISRGKIEAKGKGEIEMYFVSKV